MQTPGHTIRVLNSLLRGELSAIETYSHAIHKFPDSADQGKLENMRADHLESVATLREVITELGGDPFTHSGAWGSFAKTVESVASVFGDSPAMSALKQGEAHGLREYEDALSDEEVDSGVKSAIREDLIPPLHEHIVDLEALIC